MNLQEDGGRVVDLKRVAGYGFINSEALDAKVFFHFNDQVEPDDRLCEGDYVTYQLAEEDGKKAAKAVRRLRSIY
jgi:cold shock CspA family protein